ncbi:MAG: hypothetical protein A3I78_11805 [Gammaproteobacteria bacterium RIFCSPLOWO2_02_FULL_56_15]|nr:MAG: hypothetical protein A3I78_11805 [Gammaproteobacteria bacterium RIFCSPLOWO2_02_FULL_56_15]
MYNRLTGMWTTLLAVLLSAPVFAEWKVQAITDTGTDQSVTFASCINGEGYRLDIYRDPGNAIRTRFSLSDGLQQLAPKSCPTFQIDKDTPQNHSIHDAPCISTAVRAEYILGHVENKQIASATLRSFMDGVAVRFRFALNNGDYRETVFSLGGSRSAIVRAIGQEYRVLAPR